MSSRVQDAPSFDPSSFQVFGSRSGKSLPEPIGTVSKFRMWLQRKVPGLVATDLLAAAGGEVLACRIAQAAHKLHQAGVPATPRHTMADELRLLERCLPTVAQVEQRWAERIERLLDACYRLGAATPEGAKTALNPAAAWPFPTGSRP